MNKWAWRGAACGFLHSCHTLSDKIHLLLQVFHSKERERECLINQFNKYGMLRRSKRMNWSMALKSTKFVWRLRKHMLMMCYAYQMHEDKFNLINWVALFLVWEPKNTFKLPTTILKQASLKNYSIAPRVTFHYFRRQFLYIFVFWRFI
jgi:hypothetical protein